MRTHTSVAPQLNKLGSNDAPMAVKVKAGASAKNHHKMVVTGVLTRDSFNLVFIRGQMEKELAFPVMETGTDRTQFLVAPIEEVKNQATFLVYVQVYNGQGNTQNWQPMTLTRLPQDGRVHLKPSW